MLSLRKTRHRPRSMRRLPRRLMKSRSSRMLIMLASRPKRPLAPPTSPRSTLMMKRQSGPSSSKTSSNSFLPLCFASPTTSQHPPSQRLQKARSRSRAVQKSLLLQEMMQRLRLLTLKERARSFMDRGSFVSRTSSMTSSSYARTLRRWFPSLSGLIPIRSPFLPR